ncbi:MAG: twin-arginine translocation signal domain-containing protein [Acidimicrobiia bacterium]
MSLVTQAGGLLESRVSRRSFIARSTLAGAALTVAPLRFLLEPVTAYAAICSCAASSCDCGALCCDGYTEFCCTLTGKNECPPGSVAGGWWKADGSGFCDVDGIPQPRFYVDCNARVCDCACGTNGTCVPECAGCTCTCGNGDCGNRKTCCTAFRYGQCNLESPCIGPITCRVVTCSPPWVWDATCTQTSATDNATAFHNAACLAAFLPTGGIPVVGDWDGDGVATAGVFHDGTWYLKNRNDSGPPELVFPYGNPGDIPVVGNWDGQGGDTVGVVRSNGHWFLRNSNSPGVADLEFWYGNPGDLFVVGDWDGDGVDTPGAIRSNGHWFLRNSNSPGFADLEFWYGNPGDRFVVGDWDGDGVDGPGVVRQSGHWFLRNTPTIGVADRDFWFGNPGDIPVVGNWDGQGGDTIGVVRSDTWYLRNSLSSGSADVVLR